MKKYAKGILKCMLTPTAMKISTFVAALASADDWAGPRSSNPVIADCFWSYWIFLQRDMSSSIRETMTGLPIDFEASTFCLRRRTACSENPGEPSRLANHFLTVETWGSALEKVFRTYSYALVE